MRYRLEVRLTASDVGSRVVIRWRRPAPAGSAEPAGSGEPVSSGEPVGSEEVADVLGVLEVADTRCFAVRKASGELVTIPRDRALAGKTVPPAPRRRPDP